MKRIYLLLLTGLMMGGIARAQVTVTGADAATNAASPFTTLRAAFISINATAQTANTISITITANTTETASAVLNQSTGPWTSLSIRPGSGATVTISGAIAAPLIDLNGADNVTIDGSNNGSTSKDMTLTNTDLGGSAIRFIEDATANTVKNCIVQSVNASPANGTILFSTSTGTSGNSSNIINNCDIRDGATVPVNAVYSNGSGGAPNGSNTISGCRIFNFSGAGVLVSSTGAGNGWTINPTSFYQTATRTVSITVISLQGGSGHTISGNSIGGAASDRSGTPFTVTGSSATFTGISLAVGTASATNVQGNTLSNLNISGSSSQTFRGITVTSGNVNIGTTTGNTIGGLAAAYDTVRVNYDADMIENSGTGIVNIENNLVGNVAYYNAGGDRLFGIRGIAGTVSIKNNIVRDLKSNSTETSFSFMPGGIWLSTTVAGANVEGNQVYNIAHTNPGTSPYTIAGIYVSGVSSTGTPTTIRKNKVYGITAAGTGTGTNSPRVWGIHVAGGSATYTNNMVSVGTGSGLETRLNGIQDLGSGANNYYFNSVYTSGTTSTGANNSYAFNRSGTTTVELRNNIFANSRTGGSGFHVGIANTNASATGWSATASNYNDLYSSASGTTAQWLGTAVGNNRDLPGWKAAQSGGSGGDANSVPTVPGFISVTNLHIDPNNGYLHDNLGTPFGSIGDDIDGNSRSGSTPDLGAHEFTGIAPSIDVSAQAITGIPASACPNNSVPISVTVKNEAGTTLDFSTYSMTITLNITGASTQTLTATLTTGTLGAGVSQSYLLSPNAVLSANGTHNFAASITLTGETNTANNTANASIAINGTAAATLPQTVNFTGYTGANLTALFPNWSVATGATTPTGSTSAWTSSYWTSPADTTIRINLFTNTANEWIVGPKFLATATTELRFDAAITDFAATTADPSGMQGTDDKVVVKISTDCGLTYSDLYTFNAANTVSLTNVQTAQTINLSSYAGQTIIIAFFATDGPIDDSPDYDFHIDDIHILNTIPIDAGATTLALPAAATCYGATETVSVTVKNYGTATLDFSVTPLTVNTNVTGAVIASLSGTLSTGTLAPNATVNVPMSTTLNMTTAGTYTFNASATVTGDGNAGNDAMTPVNRTPATLAGGTYTVGSGGNYATITAAVAAYNNATCITGAIVFNLIDNNYPSETFPVTINANGAASSTNTLTIKPTLANTTITGSDLSSIFRLNGADYIIIDGSNNGTASKDLTIENTNTDPGSVVVWINSTASDGATNITIKNCIIKGNAPLTTFAGIAATGSTSGNAEVANTNLVIQNNTISKSKYGITSLGSSIAQTGTVISGNTIGSATVTDYIGNIGVTIRNSNGAAVNSNNIFNIINGTEGNPTGIYIDTGVTNSTFNANRIDNISYTGGGGYGGKGMDVNTGNAASNVIISNNMISNIGGDGWSSLLGDAIVGIRIGATAGSTTTTGGIKLYYNTVNLTGSFAGNGSGTRSATLYISSTATALDIRNNIFANSLDNTNASDKSWAINSDGANTAFTNIDNNDYWVSGAAGVLGFLTSDAVDLAAIQASFGGNTNSQNAQPSFVSATDMHLLTPDANNYTYLESKGVVVSVTTDFENQSRPNGSAPDIGADEFVGDMPPCGDVTGLAATNITATSVDLNWNVTPGATGYEYAVTTSATPPVSGTATTNTFVTPVSGLTAATVYYAYVRSNCGGGNFGNWAFVSFTTLCTNSTLPLSEGFNTSGTSVFPICWTQQTVVGTNNISFQASSTDPTTAPFEGTRFVHWNSYNISAGDETRLVSRAITTTGTASVDVEFRWFNENSTSYNSGAYLDEGVQVQYSLDGTTWIDAGAFIPRYDATLTSGTGQWKLKTVTLPAGAGNQPTIYVGFKFHSEFGDNCSLDAAVIQASPTCIPPTGLTVLPASSTTANVSWTAASPAPAIGYQWKVVLMGAGSGGSAVATGTTGAGVTIATATGLTTAVQYDVYVRSICAVGDTSSYAGPTGFFLNDEAAGAILLTVGGGCTGAPYNNIGATASTNEVYPSCSGDKIAPVWFKFKAPSSGAVRISTDLGTNVTFYDTKVGLFSATDSTNYSTFEIISCDDDGGSTTAISSPATFGYASVVYAVGLTPDFTYWIAVDKYSSTASGITGDFCIAVDELSSNMLASATSSGCTSNETPNGGLTAPNYKGWVPLIESTLEGGSKLIAMVRDTTGNVGGPVDAYDSTYLYKNTGAVRQDATSGEYYLDRNFHIGNPSVSNVQVKLFFTDAELAALKAVDPAANLSNLRVTRQVGECATDFAGVGTAEIAQTDSGSVGGAKWIGFTTPGFSNFYLHSTRAPIITKVFLQGAFDSTIGRHKDVSTSWRDILNNNALVQPYDSAGFGNYNGGETVPGGFFTSDNSHARDPLDWVLLEVKDVTLSKIIRRAALVREDGKIVDINGDSLVTFNGLATGNYYITIRHRNHLGISTQSLLPVTSKALGVAPPVSTYDFDFSTASYANIYGDSLAFRRELGVNVMIGGNANHTGSGLTRVSYGGSNNDPGAVLQYLSSSPLGNVFPRYSKSDVNLDGRVRYGGSQNDPGFILARVLKGLPLTIILEQKR